MILTATNNRRRATCDYRDPASEMVAKVFPGGVITNCNKNGIVPIKWCFAAVEAGGTLLKMRKPVGRIPQTAGNYRLTAG